MSYSYLSPYWYVFARPLVEPTPQGKDGHDTIRQKAEPNIFMHKPLSVFNHPKVGKGCSQNKQQGSKETKKKLRWNFFFPNSLHHTTISRNILKFLFLPKEKKKKRHLYWSGIFFFFFARFGNNRWVVLQYLPDWDVEVLFPRPPTVKFRYHK